MWRDRILAAKKEKGISTKSMAEYAQMTEKTVARILSGETQTPYVGNVITLGASVGLSPQEIFSETGLVVGGQDLATAQAEIIAAQAEIARLNDAIAALTTENALLQKELKHKEEIVELHNLYINYIRKHNKAPEA